MGRWRIGEGTWEEFRRQKKSIVYMYVYNNIIVIYNIIVCVYVYVY